MNILSKIIFSTRKHFNFFLKYFLLLFFIIIILQTELRETEFLSYILIYMTLQNKNLEIKILQLQFQEQKSELRLLLCSEKQNELYNLMETLEKKYKTLLATALENQQEYFMVYFYLWCHMNFIYFLLLLIF